MLGRSAIYYPQVGNRLPTEGQLRLGDGLTSHGLHPGAVQRGKKSACGRVLLHPRWKNLRRPSAGASVALGGAKDRLTLLPRRASSRDGRATTTPSASVAHPVRRRCDGEPSHVPLAKNTRERYKGSVWVHARAASLPAQALNTITYLYQKYVETTTLFVKWTTKPQIDSFAAAII